ncbi:uncharacterized protein Fot_37558 [Forsythia ovata]|uniref:Uncharacterized protein n=1 Tax=Forsythia ovata TaxID=205694 RepID=A0ABD1S035_9LAMI
MASACVNNIGMSPETFLDCPPTKYQSYEWLSPRISFSRKLPDEEASKAARDMPSNKTEATSNNAVVEKSKKSSPELSSEAFVDFEFWIEDPVIMLLADDLFSDGKLMPLHCSSIQKSIRSVTTTFEVRSPDMPKLLMRNEIWVGSAIDDLREKMGVGWEKMIIFWLGKNTYMYKIKIV